MKRDHNTNTIWFQFSDKAGLSQRCFSDKACPPGCSARCRVYASPAVRIADPLRSALFPNSKEQKKKDAEAAVHVAKMLAYSNSSSSSSAAASSLLTSEGGASNMSFEEDVRPLSKMTALEVSQLSMKELALAQRREKELGLAKAKRMREESENLILKKQKL